MKRKSFRDMQCPIARGLELRGQLRLGEGAVAGQDVHQVGGLEPEQHLCRRGADGDGDRVALVGQEAAQRQSDAGSFPLSGRRIIYLIKTIKNMR